MRTWTGDVVDLPGVLRVLNLWTSLLSLAWGYYIFSLVCWEGEVHIFYNPVETKGWRS